MTDKTNPSESFNDMALRIWREVADLTKGAVNPREYARRLRDELAKGAEPVAWNMRNELLYLFHSTAEDGQWEESGVHNFVKAMLAAMKEQK